MRWIPILILLAMACDADNDAPAIIDAAQPDLAVDAAQDARASDAALRPPDAQPVDAALDTTRDAEVDAMVDAAPDATSDAVIDATPPPRNWRILLIGNSYVASNRLDVLLEGLMRDDPGIDQVNVVRVSRGGYRLIQHANDADTPDTPLHGHLAAPGDDWNAVVLQEQSQIPGFPSNHPARLEMIQGGRRLHALAQARDARTLLMLTWGRRDGDASNPQRFPDFETMQGHLNAGYEELAAVIDNAQIAPVGPAFGVVRIADQAAFEGLYSGDGSHPSLAGSYIAAAVLYRALTGRLAQERAWAPDGLMNAAQLRSWADEASVPE